MPHYAIKFLRKDGRAPSQGYQYELPVDGNPSKWYSKTKSKQSIECCGHGFHASTLEGLEEWFNYYYWPGVNCYIVEINGKIAYDGRSKVSCENMRIICEIPLKKSTRTSGGFCIQYKRDNLRSIRKFCRDNSYGIVDYTFLNSLVPDRYNNIRIKND